MSLLLVLPILPKSFHSHLRIFFRTVPKPGMPSIPLSFLDAQHKVQLKSNLHNASPSYSWPFCTFCELRLRLLLILLPILHVVVMYWLCITTRLFSGSALVVTLGVGIQGILVQDSRHPQTLFWPEQLHFLVLYMGSLQ